MELQTYGIVSREEQVDGRVIRDRFFVGGVVRLIQDGQQQGGLRVFLLQLNQNNGSLFL